MLPPAAIPNAFSLRLPPGSLAKRSKTNAPLDPPHYPMQDLNNIYYNCNGAIERLFPPWVGSDLRRGR